jgi:hypothetical protein
MPRHALSSILKELRKWAGNNQFRHELNVASYDLDIYWMRELLRPKSK